MNFKKATEALKKTGDKTCTIQQALSHPSRWEAYWMLYSTKESQDSKIPYYVWIGYADRVMSKPE